MSRLSGDQIIDGKQVNGYDYEKQCWVLNRVIQRCGHPEQMDCKCYGKEHAGESI